MRRPGFTLIEVLVVMAIIATLLSIAAPRYFESLRRARETALRTDLRVLREAIDQFHADTGHYPRDLQALVDGRYVREIPVDPITGKDTTWTVTPVPDGKTAGAYDVRSGAPGAGHDGSPYATW